MSANEAASIARATDSNLLRALALEHLADVRSETDPRAAIETLEEAAGIQAASGNTVGSERVARVLAALS